MIHHILSSNRDQHYGINVNHDKNRVLFQLGDGMEQIRVQLTAEEVDRIISDLQIRKEQIRPSGEMADTPA